MSEILRKLQAVLLFAVGTTASCIAAAHAAPDMSMGFFLGGIVLAYISMLVNQD